MTSATPKYLSRDPAAIGEFVDQFDVFLFDCDGVLWSGDHVFDGTAETLELLRAKGKRIIFVTNNSTKSRADYKKKLDALGIPATVDEIFGSGYSSAVYIARILALPPPKNKVFVLGEAGIEAELRSEGVPFVGATDPSFRREMTPDDFQALADGTALDPDVGVVLSGLDYHLNYLKLSYGYHYLKRGGAQFLATNRDATLPAAGTLFPGAGTMAIALRHMTGQEPIVMGKPSQAMMDAIEGKFQFDRKKACMVGDRLNTDIRFGIDGGLGGTLAVLTGVVKQQDWEGDGGDDGVVVKPGCFVDRLSDLRAYGDGA